MLDIQFTDSDDFAYGIPADAVPGLRVKVSIFADRRSLRDEISEDVLAAGLHIEAVEPLARLLDGNDTALGDIVLVDCPEVDGEILAALSSLDIRAGQMVVALIVSTTVEALDSVFACLDQSSPRILVSPSQVERLVALGQVMANMPVRRVRELSEEDRMVLLRLTQQVTEIGEKLATFTPAMVGGVHGVASKDAAAFKFEPLNKQVLGDQLVQSGKAGMPDPRIVRKIIRQRQMRARFFDGDLFADPAWDMLLDLIAAQAEHTKVSVTSLCIASGVPPTTALRWIGQMTEAGLLQRMEDETSRRRAFIALAPKAVEAMSAYFHEVVGSIE